MVRSVLKKDNPLIYKQSQKIVNVAEAGQLIKDLRDTLTSIRGLYQFKCCGLAAPQIGELYRANVVNQDNRHYILINPKIIAHSNERTPMREACLSFFDYRGMALRYTSVTVEALDENGQLFTIEAKDDFSSLLQHELDHLNGRLYDSRLAPGQDLFKVPDMPVIP